MSQVRAAESQHRHEESPVVHCSNIRGCIQTKLACPSYSRFHLQPFRAIPLVPCSPGAAFLGDVDSNSREGKDNFILSLENLVWIQTPVSTRCQRKHRRRVCRSQTSPAKGFPASDDQHSALDSRGPIQRLQLIANDRRILHRSMPALFHIPPSHWPSHHLMVMFLLLALNLLSVSVNDPKF